MKLFLTNWGDIQAWFHWLHAHRAPPSMLPACWKNNRLEKSVVQIIKMVGVHQNWLTQKKILSGYWSQTVFLGKKTKIKHSNFLSYLYYNRLTTSTYHIKRTYSCVIQLKKHKNPWKASSKNDLTISKKIRKRFIGFN